MSALKKGALCVIVAGCPENIGIIVEVVAHLGRHEGREDAYEIKTVTERKFNQLWRGNELVPGYSCYAITDRYKLRPLIESKDDLHSIVHDEKIDVMPIEC